MPKLSLRFALVLALIVPTFSYAAIECSAINFDLYPNAANRTIVLTKDEQQFHTVFTGTQEGHHFNIVVDKADMDVHGSITTADGITHNFTAAFSSDGRFEFASMSGGNIMMPAKLIALSCLKK